MAAPTKKPNPIDAHVGSRVRLRRTMMSMSQEKLGDALGITFQQIQMFTDARWTQVHDVSQHFFKLFFKRCVAAGVHID